MKKNAGRLSKKLFAAMMAGTLMTAMVGANVSAATLGNNIENANVTIKKRILKEANVYLPNTTFTFDVEPGAAVSAGEGQKEIKAGPENGVTFSDNSITSSATGSYDIAATEVTLTDTAALQVHANEFTEPGVYRYVVSEDSTNPYEGMTYSTEEYYFDVYVEYVGDDLTVTAYTFVDDATSTEKNGEVVFTNDYSDTSSGGGTHDITLSKVVTGNQGSKTENFSFTIEVTGENGEQYYVALPGGGTLDTPLTSGTSKTITLKAGQSATIYGLSADDTYEITEDDYSAKGYTTKVKVNDENETSGRTASGLMGNEDKTIVVTNDKQVSTPTGIAMTYGPYALMVALAGGMAVLFLRRRNREEY